MVTHHSRFVAPFAASVLIGLFLFASSVSAMVVRGGEAYEVGAETTLEGDLYYLVKNFKLSGASTGDLFALGTTISLPGNVGGDAFVVGSSIEVRGTTVGDMRIIGGEIAFASSTIGEDLVVIGGTIIVEEGTVIQGDLLVYGDYLVLDGTVEGNVEAHVQSIEIRGQVGHDTNITAHKSVSLIDQAYLKGSFLYTAPKEAFRSDTVMIDGETSFELKPQGDDITGLDVLLLTFSILLSIFAALAFVFLPPRFSNEMGVRVFEGGGMLAVQGIILLIAWPVVGFMLCMTLVGIIPGVLLLIGYLLVGIATMAYMPVIAGIVLAQWLKKERMVRWDWIVLGAMCLAFIMFLPYIGFFVRSLLFVSIFGSFTFRLFDLVRSQRTTPHVSTVPHDVATATPIEKPETSTDTNDAPTT